MMTKHNSRATKGALLFDGKEKQVYAVEENAQQVIFLYKDVTVAYNDIKRARFRGKGLLDNRISALLLDYLNAHDIQTHFIRVLGEREQLCRKIEIIPLEVIVRNRVAGTQASRYGLPEGFRPGRPLVDLRYNNDDLDNPLIGEGLALAMGLAGETEIRRMLAVAEESNVLLTELFRQAGIELVELKIEFGRAADNGEVIISDEISPDTCRLWDLETGERLDKDRFRLDLGDVVPAYKTVLERLTAVLQQASSGEDAENSTEASGQQE